MTEPDWTLLAQRIDETWEQTRRLPDMAARLDRIESQLTVVIRLTQAREAEHAAVKAATDAFADPRGLVLELGRRVDELGRRLS